MADAQSFYEFLELRVIRMSRIAEVLIELRVVEVYICHPRCVLKLFRIVHPVVYVSG